MCKPWRLMQERLPVSEREQRTDAGAMMDNRRKKSTTSERNSGLTAHRRAKDSEQTLVSIALRRCLAWQTLNGCSTMWLCGAKVFQHHFITFQQLRAIIFCPWWSCSSWGRNQSYHASLIFPDVIQAAKSVFFEGQASLLTYFIFCICLWTAWPCFNWEDYHITAHTKFHVRDSQLGLRVLLTILQPKWWSDFVQIIPLVAPLQWLLR